MAEQTLSTLAPLIINEESQGSKRETIFCIKKWRKSISNHEGDKTAEKA
jgi:hypothetical protein